LSKQRGQKFFGMEYPQGAAEAGAAQCLLLPALPSMEKVADSECEAERAGGEKNFRLGSGHKLAVYEHDGTASGNGNEEFDKELEQGFSIGDDFELSIGFKQEWQQNKGESFDQIWVTSTYCAVYTVLFHPGKIPKVQGFKYTNWKHVYEGKRFPNNFISNEKSSFTLGASGAMPGLGIFDQTLSAEGTLAFDRPHVSMKTRASGRFQIQWTIGKSWCQTYQSGYAGALAEVEFYLGAATEIGPDGVALEAYTGLGGALGGFGSSSIWEGTCDCEPGLTETCELIIGGVVNGQLTFRISELGCGRTPKLDIFVDVSVEVKVLGFGLEKEAKFELVKGKQIGGAWTC